MTRKTNLARLLSLRVDGIHLTPFERGEIGPELFRHACLHLIVTPISREMGALL